MLKNKRIEIQMKLGKQFDCYRYVSYVSDVWSGTYIDTFVTFSFYTRKEDTGAWETRYVLIT